MRDDADLPELPSTLRRLMRPLPLTPLRLLLQRVVESAARRRPGLFARLGAHAEKRFLIDPTDLPFGVLLTPRPEAPALRLIRRSGGGVEPRLWDARIAGSLGALIGLTHGAYDGDALFFRREIVIEGDTEASLALRNAIDDAEIDLAAEAAAALRLEGTALDRGLRAVLPSASRLTGFALTRSDWSET